MIALPPGVVGVEICDTGQAVPLRADEAALVANAVEKRRREFALGRACAHAALNQLGKDAMIGRRPDGAPLWPAGVTGSITHTDGYACAVVTTTFRAIGVDAERVGGVGDDLLPRLFDDAECARLMAMTAGDRRLFATLGFSAKEACFKAWGSRFRDIHIMWGDGSFHATSAGGSGQGRFQVEGDLALTFIAV
jgi:4'-phosphopantetheinyl transferase EntD